MAKREISVLDDVLTEREHGVARVVVRTASEGDQRQLQNWLGARDAYEFTTTDIRSGGYDCCILDWEALIDEQDALQARKRDTRIPLPVVLLVPDPRAETILHTLRTDRRDLETLVDEILRMPLSQVELEQRLDSVLRARNQAARLHEEHEQLHAIRDQHPGHGVVITDTEGRIEYVNRGFEQQSGYSAEDVLGENPQILNSGEHDKSFFTDLWETILAGEVWQDEVINERKDGERYIVDQTITPLTDPDGEIERLVAVNHEITDLRELADAFDEQRTQLELLNQVLRHDIRNDMHVILAWAEFLETHVESEGEEMLDRILSSGQHVVELTDIAKTIVEGIFTDVDPQLEPVEIPSFLTQVIERRRETFDCATISVDGDIPDVAVNANEMLSAVFRNLINNAIQHNDSDEPTVAIAADERDGSVQIRVADNGPGIRPERRVEIFDRDVKGLDSEGTGMGLYLVDELIEMYDGSIRIEANEPRGSVFVVELPTIERDMGGEQ
ncbi:MAG: ATP-binding protein [archaeon]